MKKIKQYLFEASNYFKISIIISMLSACSLDTNINDSNNIYCKVQDIIDNLKLVEHSDKAWYLNLKKDTAAVNNLRIELKNLRQEALKQIKELNIAKQSVMFEQPTSEAYYKINTFDMVGVDVLENDNNLVKYKYEITYTLNNDFFPAKHIRFEFVDKDGQIFFVKVVKVLNNNKLSFDVVHHNILLNLYKILVF